MSFPRKGRECPRRGFLKGFLNERRRGRVRVFFLLRGAWGAVRHQVLAAAAGAARRCLWGGLGGHRQLLLGRDGKTSDGDAAVDTALFDHYFWFGPGETEVMVRRAPTHFLFENQGRCVGSAADRDESYPLAF